MRNWTNGAWMSVIGAGLIVIGSLLPWVRLEESPFGPESVSGTSGDGQITIALGILALVFAALAFGPSARFWYAVCVMVFGGIAALVAGYDWINLSRVASAKYSLYGGLSVGWGLIVCAIGAVIATVGGVVRWRDLKAPPEQVPRSGGESLES
jgi:hypothetical protein